MVLNISLESYVNPFFERIYILLRTKTHRQQLIEWIEDDNERRKANQLAIIEITKDVPFELTKMNAAEAAMALSSVNAYTSTKEHRFVIATMIYRLNQIWNNEAPRKYFKPSYFGPNMYDYWMPIGMDLLRTIFLVLCTIIGVHVAYTYVEDYHHNNQCSHWRNMYSFHCYAAKKVRHHLEEMNYNTVYTVFCGLCIAGTTLLLRLQKYIKDAMNVEH